MAAGVLQRGTSHLNITPQICAFFCRLIRLFSKIPVINDDLPLKILAGSVVIKPNVKEINGSTVVFTDGTIAEKVRGLLFFNCAFEERSESSRAISLQVDMIVFATGYNYDFPYLPKNTMQKSGDRMGLYKHVFPPHLEHPTLAIVGFIHALGAIMPQAEMQARWVARVFKGEALQHLDHFRLHLFNYFSLFSCLFRTQ